MLLYIIHNFWGCSLVHGASIWIIQPFPGLFTEGTITKHSFFISHLCPGLKVGLIDSEPVLTNAGAIDVRATVLL